MMEYAIGIVALIGGFFTMIAAAGLVKLPDVFIRMHASTKAGTLGSSLTLLAAALFFAETSVSIKALIGVFFLMLTAPIAAHLIGRAANASQKSYINESLDP
jgi:multicomponent Na+:H+ antiporter subunit G